jgi:hypothetical protein
VAKPSAAVLWLLVLAVLILTKLILIGLVVDQKLIIPLVTWFLVAEVAAAMAAAAVVDFVLR